MKKISLRDAYKLNMLIDNLADEDLVYILTKVAEDLTQQAVQAPSEETGTEIADTLEIDNEVLGGLHTWGEAFKKQAYQVNEALGNSNELYEKYLNIEKSVNDFIKGAREAYGVANEEAQSAADEAVTNLTQPNNAMGYNPRPFGDQGAFS